MARKKVYKTGRKNPNAYVSRKVIRKRLRFAGVLLIVVACAIFGLLEKFGVTNWGSILDETGMIDTVTKTKSDFSVYYLDVGQGDCTVITSGKETMVIDTSISPRVEDVYSALKSLNVDTIDYLVITHPHDDHMGNAVSLIKSHNVKNIVMPKLSEENTPTTSAYEDLLNAILSNDVKAIAAEPGRSFMLGDAKVDIFAPLSKDKNLNNMSAVLKVTYGATSFLFQGDAEKKVENTLLREDVDVSADIIKVGHHGSKTSSGDKYIKAVSPKAAVISCGANNDYGHPHTETLKTLQDNGVDTFITSLSGDIVAVSDGKKIKVSVPKTGEVKIYE